MKGAAQVWKVCSVLTVTVVVTSVGVSLGLLVLLCLLDNWFKGPLNTDVCNFCKAGFLETCA